jgi:hypothetical protein
MPWSLRSLMPLFLFLGTSNLFEVEFESTKQQLPKSTKWRTRYHELDDHAALVSCIMNLAFEQTGWYSRASVVCPRSWIGWTRQIAFDRRQETFPTLQRNDMTFSQAILVPGLDMWTGRWTLDFELQLLRTTLDQNSQPGSHIIEIIGLLELHASLSQQ